MELDTQEKSILTLLQQHGRMPNVELAERIGLSESPTFRRVKQLEESGVIAGYSAIADQHLLGLQVTAFVHVSMERQSEDLTAQFHQAVSDEPHIIECHAMSGSHDYLIKLVAQSMDHFAELCMERVLRFPGVRHVESAFSLKQIKHSRVLPVS